MGRKTQLVAAEPVACPKLTRGDYLYDINDFSGTTPVTRMYTLGSKFLADVAAILADPTRALIWG